MGLDQYIEAVMPHPENTDFRWAWDRDDEGKVHEIHYWRKHPDMHGLMEELWTKKMTEAGTPSEPETEGWFAGEIVFNCQPIRLTFADLEFIESVVKRDELPETSGFFFGQSDSGRKSEDLDFIRKAREAIGQDMEVYYYSWW